jgi:type I restriction enzyme R subunit
VNPHNEIVFEQDIVKALVAGGYVEGEPEKYDAEQGLYPEDLIRYLTATQPEMVDKIRQKQGADKADQDICREVSRAIDAQGCLHSLRRGVEYVGAKFSLAQFKPDNTSNAKIMQHYAANILRVVRQVRYSPFHQEMKEAGEKGSGIIDLVIFLNGIPIATLELKTDFTQSVQHAIEQYKKDRKPFNVVARKVEPLLAFNRRSLVHFAVSNEEVYMTTKLAGENTYFLPFNKGNGDASGNPPNPEGYATAYLWNEVLQKETLLRIIGRFMHLVDKDEKGNKLKPDQYRMIFPRYHQLDCVTQLIHTAAAEGPGHNYLFNTQQARVSLTQLHGCRTSWQPLR